MDSLKPSLSGGTLTSWLFCFSLLHIEKNVKHKECKKTKQNKTKQTNKTKQKTAELVQGGYTSLI